MSLVDLMARNKRVDLDSVSALDRKGFEFVIVHRDVGVLGRDAKEYFDDIPDVALDPETLKLADQILKTKATNFDPSQFVDRYEEAVVELLKKKQAGIAVSRERTVPRPQNVVNIMDALRQGVAQEKAASAPPKKSPKRTDGQSEMLLPLAGKAKKVATAKPSERPSGRQKNVGRTLLNRYAVPARKSTTRARNSQIQLASSMSPGVP